MQLTLRLIYTVRLSVKVSVIVTLWVDLTNDNNEALG